MKKYFIITISIILIALLVKLGLYSYYTEPAMLNITRYKLQDEQLRGIKIAFPSDFHVRPYQKERLNDIVQIINEENPDIVLSCGDYVAGHTKNVTMQIEEIAQALSKIKSKHGFYTVLGNHDGWYGNERIKKALTSNGIKVLNNENATVNINGKKVYIAGVEDIMTGKPNISLALKNTNQPTIFLTHSPDLFPDIPKGVNLTLAGHTHGGQIRIPIIDKPIFTASKYYDRYCKDLIVENGKKMIVSRGIGVSIIPVRFNCVPELVIIEFE